MYWLTILAAEDSKAVMNRLLLEGNVMLQEMVDWEGQEPRS